MEKKARKKKQNIKTVQKEENQLKKEDSFVLIREKFVGFIQDRIENELLVRKPSTRELQELTGLSHVTIRKYIKDISFEPQNDSLRFLTPDVMMSLFRSTQSGNVQAQRLWMELVEGWISPEKKLQIELSKKGDNTTGETNVQIFLNEKEYVPTYLTDQQENNNNSIQDAEIVE